MVPSPVYRPRLSTPPTEDGPAAPQGYSQPSPAATAYLVLLVLSCTMQPHLLNEAGPLFWRPRCYLLLSVLMHGRYVVEHAAVPLDVLDHQMLLAADEVLDADMLARFQLTAQNVLDPVACLCLRPKVGGRIRVNLAPGERSFQYLPAPASVLAVGALSGFDVQKLANI